MAKKITTDMFIEKACDVHGDKYDYSQVNYVNNSTPVKIICKKHGVFEQAPKVHYTGAGCPDCLKEFYFESFLERAKIMHGDKYDYSQVVYESGRKPVVILCPEHGPFMQSLENHVAGHGCPVCVGNKKSDLNDFIQKANVVHDNKYNYSMVGYVNNKTKVKIICPDHGVFEQKPDNHLRGDGCPKCAILKRADFLRDNSDNINQKRKTTMLERYDVSNPMRVDLFKNKLRKSMHDNGTFGTSKSEEQLYILLCDKFGKADVVRQYCNDNYPFACDFYVKSRDLYVELNAYYMHGGCWFDANNNTHVSRLESWLSLCDKRHLPQYKTAVDVWSVRDVRKRDIARQSNINYVVFWCNDLSDALLWFAMDCPDGHDWDCEYSWLPDRILSKSVLPKLTGKSLNLNQIVKYFQFDEFYKREILLWNDNDVYKNMCKLQAFLYANRAEYSGKLPSELTDADILRGMTISGIVRGYTVFDAKLMYQVLDKYDIKSVYDPCAGWGERMLASACRDVAYLGVDINEHLADGYANMIAEYNLSEQKCICEDAAKYVPKLAYDAVITCPPYGSIEKYIDKGAENLTDVEFYVWWDRVVDNATKSKPKYFCFQINTKYRDKMAESVCKYGYELRDEFFFKSNKSSHFTRKTGGVNLKKSKESMLIFVRT